MSMSMSLCIRRKFTSYRAITLDPKLPRCEENAKTASKVVMPSEEGRRRCIVYIYLVMSIAQKVEVILTIILQEKVCGRTGLIYFHLS